MHVVINNPSPFSVFESLAETKRKNSKLEMKDGYDKLIWALFPCIWSSVRQNGRKKAFLLIYLHFAVTICITVTATLLHYLIIN